MEKDQEKDTYVLQDDKRLGTVKIADDVVEMIAGLATTEVDGVCSMVGSLTNELMSKVGVRNVPKGVKVEILNNTVRCDIAVTLEYGYNIPATCQKVQEKVKSAIENMTGLSVSDVNVRIAGVNMPKGK